MPGTIAVFHMHSPKRVGGKATRPPQTSRPLGRALPICQESSLCCAATGAEPVAFSTSCLRCIRRSRRSRLSSRSSSATNIPASQRASRVAMHPGGTADASDGQSSSRSRERSSCDSCDCAARFAHLPMLNCRGVQKVWTFLPATEPLYKRSRRRGSCLLMTVGRRPRSKPRCSATAPPSRPPSRHHWAATLGGRAGGRAWLFPACDPAAGGKGGRHVHMRLCRPARRRRRRRLMMGVFMGVRQPPMQCYRMAPLT